MFMFRYANIRTSRDDRLLRTDVCVCVCASHVPWMTSHVRHTAVAGHTTHVCTAHTRTCVESTGTNASRYAHMYARIHANWHSSKIAHVCACVWGYIPTCAWLLSCIGIPYVNRFYCLWVFIGLVVILLKLICYWHNFMKRNTEHKHRSFLLANEFN